MNNEFYRKIIIGGEGGVGKSTLLHRLITGTFQIHMQMTIGIDFQVYNVDYNNMHLKLSLWDLGGQDRFRFILPQYCKGAHAGIIVYDLTRMPTVLKIGEWVKIMRDCQPHIPIILVGSKADLIEFKTVTDDAVDLYLDEYQLCAHYRISSKTGEGIHSAIMRVIKAMMEHEQHKLEIIPEIAS